MNLLEVKLKTIWGIDRFQPINSVAIFLCKMAGKKTFSRNQLIILKSIDYEIKIHNMDAEKYLSDDYDRYEPHMEISKIKESNEGYNVNLIYARVMPPEIKAIFCEVPVVPNVHKNYMEISKIKESGDE